MTNTCTHPYEAREDCGFALLPARGDGINQKTPLDRTRLVRCTDCGTLLIPDGVLVDEPPVTYPPRHICKGCGKHLTQEYSQKMGECLECIQIRIRQGRGQITSAEKQRREKIAAYRRSRRAQGLPS